MNDFLNSTDTIKFIQFNTILAYKIIILFINYNNKPYRLYIRYNNMKQQKRII